MIRADRADNVVENATRDWRAVPTIARPLGTERFVLSEGPVWDPDSASLTWVDIEAGRILTAPWADGGLSAPGSIEVGEYVGCAIPLKDARTLAALTRRLGVIGADGTTIRSRELIPAGSRLNDGKIDPQGRLVVGTISLQGPPEAQLLLRLEVDGAITVLDDDLMLANGLGWSPDGATMYSIDTLAEIIYRRDYGADTMGTRSPFAVGAHFDGMTVDAHGNLWVAIWGAGEVRCFDPSGAPVPERTIRVAAPHSSSVTFVGAALDTVVVTSASRDLTEAERERWPDAGALFCASADTIGLPPTPWQEGPLPA
jgi:sugar lactone lactonase YvrE